MVGSLFVTDDELDLMIDSSVADLYDLLTTQYGDEYFSRTSWIQTYAGTDPNISWPRLAIDPAIWTGPDDGPISAYALPDDFVRLVRVQFFVGTVTNTSVRIGTLAEYNVRSQENWTLNCTDKRAYPMHRIDTPGQVIDFTPMDWSQTRVGYRLRHGPLRQLRWIGLDGGVPVYTEDFCNGTAIDFLPVPKSSYAVQVTYVPTPTLLPNHPFPEYLIFDCAALCLEKQRSDSSTLRALQERVKARIAQYSRTPDAANAPRVVDVYGSNRIPTSGEFPPWLP